MVEGLLQDLAHGHVPNVLGEMGLGAEWRHNRRALVGKLLLLAALATAAALIAKTFRDDAPVRRLSHRNGSVR